MTGKVIKFIPRLMYGFILGDDSIEYFFHSSSVLRVKDRRAFMAYNDVRVTFDIGEFEGNPCAVNVTTIDSETTTIEEGVSS